MFSANALVRILVVGLFIALVSAGLFEYRDTILSSGSAPSASSPCASCCAARKSRSERLAGDQAKTIVPPVSTAAPVELKVVKLDQLKHDILAQPGKLVVVDLWADFCVPCKKGFPHLVELHKKYASDGLVCMSVCLDDVDDKAKAQEFLQKNDARFANYLLDEEQSAWQDHWDVKAIPLVFLYRDGKQIARFDQDDPDKQFTYADVDSAVARLLKK